MPEIDVSVCPVGSASGNPLEYEIIFKNGLNSTHGTRDIAGSSMDVVGDKELDGVLKTACSDKENAFSEGAIGNSPVVVRNRDDSRNLRVAVDGQRLRDIQPKQTLLITVVDGNPIPELVPEVDIGVCPSTSASGNPLNYRISYFGGFGMIKTHGLNPDEVEFGDTLVGTLKTPCDKKSDPFSEGALGVLPAAVVNTDEARTLTVGINGEKIGEIPARQARQITSDDGTITMSSTLDRVDIEGGVLGCSIGQTGEIEFGDTFSISPQVELDVAGPSPQSVTVDVILNGETVGSTTRTLEPGVKLFKVPVEGLDTRDFVTDLPNDEDVQVEVKAMGEKVKCGTFTITVEDKPIEFISCEMLGP